MSDPLTNNDTHPLQNHRMMIIHSSSTSKPDWRELVKAHAKETQSMRELFERYNDPAINSKYRALDTLYDGNKLMDFARRLKASMTENNASIETIFENFKLTNELVESFVKEVSYETIPSCVRCCVVFDNGWVELGLAFSNHHVYIDDDIIKQLEQTSYNNAIVAVIPKYQFLVFEYTKLLSSLENDA